MYNSHHLELFYYVARYGGMAKAVKKMPYGIQASSLSIQMTRLEKQHEVKLIERRINQLTPAGLELYEFIRPMFDNIDTFLDRLRESDSPLLRMAGPRFVLKEALGPLLKKVQREIPGLRLDLRDASRSQITRMFEEGEIDLAVTTLGERLPAGCSSRLLAELPPILILPARMRYRTAEAIWGRMPIPERLISTSARDEISRSFQRELARRSVVWKPATQTNSLDLIEDHVLDGRGVGLTLDMPGKRFPTGIRALPLPGFPRVAVGAIWHGTLHPVAERLLAELEKQAKTRIRGR